MRMTDILEKKKQGKKLSKEEIKFFIDGYTRGEIPDYQASAFTMAVIFQGLDKEASQPAAVLRPALLWTASVQAQI